MIGSRPVGGLESLQPDVKQCQRQRLDRLWQASRRSRILNHGGSSLERLPAGFVGKPGKPARTRSRHARAFPLSPPRRSRPPQAAAAFPAGSAPGGGRLRDRTSVVEGKSVSVRVDLGGRRIIKKTKNEDTQS